MGLLGAVAAGMDGVMVDALGFTLLLRGEAVAVALTATVGEGLAAALIWVVEPFAQRVTAAAVVYWHVAHVWKKNIQYIFSPACINVLHNYQQLWSIINH